MHPEDILKLNYGALGGKVMIEWNGKGGKPS
jgi:hypothetical protein